VEIVFSNYYLPVSEEGTIFDTIVRHMGPWMERKTPSTTDMYKCQGRKANPLAMLLRISENNDSKANDTTDIPKSYKYTKIKFIILIHFIFSKLPFLK